jgi:1-acyl-sn-glycerol-3-phosphate acyltransferase
MRIMNWIDLADQLWATRLWTAALLLAIYAVPLLRVISAPVQCGWPRFMKLNRRFGQWEHLVGDLRDIIATPYLAGGIVWHLWLLAETHAPEHLIWAAAAMALLSAALYCRLSRRRAYGCLLEFIRKYPTIHPQEFFDHLLCSSGAVRHALPLEPRRMIDPNDVDFREGQQDKSETVGVLTLISGLWSIMWITRLGVLAHRIRKVRAPEICSSLALIFATRTAQLARAAVTIEDGDRLPPASGLQTFAFNHMSFLDFALAPLVMAARPEPQEEGRWTNYLPHFLLAEGHFRKNPLLHRVLGIGRLAEAQGMFFVRRQTKIADKVRTEKATRLTADAARKLVSDKVELAIFPQGTRTVPYRDLNGGRLDAGYYTVRPRWRIKADGAHMKKGLAHIAAKAAILLEAIDSPSKLHIVPVAIAETGRACPRGTLKILKNTHIRMRVGEPIVVSRSSIPMSGGPGGDDRSFDRLYTEFVDQLQERVDHELKTAGRVHGMLERRMFEDVREMLGPLRIEELAIAMKEWRGEDFLVHAILDAIYACPPDRWRPFLGELTHLILNFASREDLLVFKGRVADAVPL